MADDSKYELTKLIKEEKFGDVILVSWREVESNINLLLLSRYNLLPYKDQLEADNLIKACFEEKFQFLNKLGAFKEKEYKIIQKFQQERNKLFHDSFKGEFFRRFYDDMIRKQLMQLAYDAFICGNNAFGRNCMGLDL